MATRTQLGSKLAKRLYYGNTRVRKMYKGSTLVFDDSIPKVARGQRNDAARISVDLSRTKIAYVQLNKSDGLLYTVDEDNSRVYVYDIEASLSATSRKARVTSKEFVVPAVAGQVRCGLSYDPFDNVIRAIYRPNNKRQYPLESVPFLARAHKISDGSRDTNKDITRNITCSLGRPLVSDWNDSIWVHVDSRNTAFYNRSYYGPQPSADLSKPIYLRSNSSVITSFSDDFYPYYMYFSEGTEWVRGWIRASGDTPEHNGIRKGPASGVGRATWTLPSGLDAGRFAADDRFIWGMYQYGNRAYGYERN